MLWEYRSSERERELYAHLVLLVVVARRGAALNLVCVGRRTLNLGQFHQLRTVVPNEVQKRAAVRKGRAEVGDLTIKEDEVSDSTCLDCNGAQQYPKRRVMVIHRKKEANSKAGRRQL